MKVLFVDDNLADLEAMRMLVQDSYITVAGAFVHSSDALQALSEVSFDLMVVGTDSLESDGARVVNEAAETHPHVARLLMTDVKRAAAKVVAHMYVPRKVLGDVLRRSLYATTRWRDRMGMARLTDIVLGADRLPSLPEVFLEVQKEIESDDPSIRRVGRIVENDPGLSVKLLTLVNSSLYGVRQEVGDVGQAVSMLGMSTVSSMVLAAGVFEAATPLNRRYMEKLWQDSLTVSALARAICKDEELARVDAEVAGFAGLMHDVGDIIFLKSWPKDFLEIEGEDRLEEERRVFGATHADVGAYLGTLWMLPDGVVEAIAYHHEPSKSKSSKVVSPITAIHVARAIVDSSGDVEAAPLDLEHVGAIGTHKVERWFDLANMALGAVA